MAKRNFEMDLGYVKGHRALEVICLCLFNDLGLDAGGVPVHYDDTVATYSVKARSRQGGALTRARQAQALAYFQGLRAALRAMDVAQAGAWGGSQTILVLR